MQSIENMWETAKAFWSQTFLGVPLIKYFEIIISVLIILIIGRIIVAIILKYLKAFSERGENDFDKRIYEALKRPLIFMVYVTAIYFLFDHLNWGGKLHAITDNILNSLITLLFFWFLFNLVKPLDFLFRRWEVRLSRPIVEWIIRLWRMLLIFTAAATILQIWGIQIGPIIAGLGLFSVALALGAQDLFKNLIAGIVILVERRFNIGDRVAGGSVDGVVEHIGFRSTRIRTLDKIPVYVPNTTFSDQALINYAGQTNRKFEWRVGLVYGTGVEQLRKIKQDILDYMRRAGDFTDFKVYVESFGDSAINIYINTLINDADYTHFMTAKENLIFKIMEVVAGNKSDFAFPSQTLYVEPASPGSTIIMGSGDNINVEGLLENDGSNNNALPSVDDDGDPGNDA